MGQELSDLRELQKLVSFLRASAAEACDASYMEKLMNAAHALEERIQKQTLLRWGEDSYSETSDKYASASESLEKN